MADTTTTIVVAVLSSGAIATIVAAFINGAFTKRKLSAEATQIITDAASGVVTEIQKQRDDLRAEMKQLREDHRTQIRELIADHLAEVARLESECHLEREQWKHALQLHVAWDWIAIEKLAQLNVTLPDPPSILPDRMPPPGQG